ncbi:vacuolar sorting protein VPS1 [Colletotrichum sojae]|uniref:Vacuolar sorting protein VPS1 n=1 Tax=Colletotrichum sojae TaxID=2175907 RepID=A0A8H6IVK7_9PEZI|nr:vacuolar sorting protein VPS1 [Colletotrichum sojae]
MNDSSYVSDACSVSDSSSVSGDISTPNSPSDNSEGEWESVLSTTDARASKEAIPENPFDMKSSRALPDAMDELQSCGGSQELATPEIVVFGCQSAGKSSLLRTLTDIPFPVGRDCCTRFPTRIVSRQTAPGTFNAVKITITAPEMADNVFNYPPDSSWKSYKYESDDLDTQEFERITQEISAKYMKIRKGKGIKKKNFASQVLRIEISGPTRAHFSILDLPGTMSVPHNASEKEVHGVARCVAAASTDLSNERILARASAFVFTKCDRVADPSLAFEIATGAKKHPNSPILVGWFVVRNRDETDGDDFDLGEAERKLFSETPWTKIPKERRGSDMLRRHLADLLSGKVQENFTGVQATILELLRDARRSRRCFAEPRPTHALRLHYIRDVVEWYAVAAGKVLASPGSLNGVQQTRAKVHNANKSFTEAMIRSGHALDFQDVDVDVEKNFAEALRVCYPHFAPKKDQVGAGKANPVPPVKHTNGSTPSKKSTIFGPGSLIIKITFELPVWQSTELPGLVNAEFIRHLFQLLAAPWQNLAQSHINAVSAQIVAAFESLLNDACCPFYGSEVIVNELTAVLSRFQTKAKERAMSELEEYCRRQREAHLQTTDPRFDQMLQKWRTSRLLRSLVTVPVYGESGLDPVSHAELVFKTMHHSVEDNMIYDIHDIVRVYYELAREGFIRYVTRHIIEHFVTCEDGPLKALSTDWVSSLTKEEVEKLGGEDEDTISKRAHFDDLIEKYKRAGLIAVRAREQSLKSEG